MSNPKEVLEKNIIKEIQDFIDANVLVYETGLSNTGKMIDWLYKPYLPRLGSGPEKPFLPPQKFLLEKDLQVAMELRKEFLQRMKVFLMDFNVGIMQGKWDQGQLSALRKEIEYFKKFPKEQEKRFLALEKKAREVLEASGSEQPISLFDKIKGWLE